MKKITYLLTVSMIFAASCSTPEPRVGMETTSTTIITVVPESLRIAAVGDISCGTSQRKSGNYDCQDERVANLVANYGADYALLLGDIQYPSHGIDDFVENFLPIWDGVAKNFLPIPGNHEYDGNIQQGYFNAWNKGQAGVGYYTTPLNENWVVIGLDTNDVCQKVSCSNGSEQYLWFQGELAKYANKCVIVMTHHPRFSSGVHGSNEEIADIFDLAASSGAVFWLSGHDHHYERFNLPIPSFVVGTGGKDLRGIGQQVDGSMVAIDDNHGALLIELTENTAIAEFVNIDGQTLDTHSMSCDK